jgi:SNF2 family DNA or RNA helicase
MFSSIERMFGLISLKQSDSEITINGIPADLIYKDIQKLWLTSRINEYMFTRKGRNDFSFPKFFALEVKYALEKIEDEQKSHTRKKALRTIISLLETETWVAKTSEKVRPILDFSRLSALKWSPQKHQREFLDRYNILVPHYGLNGFMLAADPGTGKTFTGLALAECLKADVVFIICPKKVVETVWKHTISVNHKNPTLWISTEGTPIGGAQTKKFYIVHYESLGALFEISKKRRNEKVVIILDEGHNMNEITSLRTNLFVKFCSEFKDRHVLWMSGTPIKAIGSEMIPFLRTIDNMFTPDVESRFLKIFGQKSSRANDILAHRLGLVLHKVPKSVVMKKEPPIQRMIKVTIPRQERFTISTLRKEMQAFMVDRLDYYNGEMRSLERIYQDCVGAHEDTLTTTQQKRDLSTYREYIKRIKSGYDPIAMVVESKFCNEYELKRIIPSLPQDKRNVFKNARSAIKYVQLKVRGEALGLLSKKRAECHIEMLINGRYKLDNVEINLYDIIVDAEKKTVIFSSYADVVRRAESFLQKSGLRPTLVYQDTNSRLPQILKEFSDVDAVNPLVATYKSLSEGVPLIEANTMILIDPPFREYIRTQAIARIDRQGQDTQTYVYQLQLDTGSESNVSTRAADILEWCTKQLDSLMGGDVNIRPEELVYDVVETGFAEMAFRGIRNMFGLE